MIDTEAKRRSVAGYTNAPINPPPSGTIGTGAREAVTWLYAGIPAAPPAAPTLPMLPARFTQTLIRDQLWALQTPQILRRDALARAFETCPLPLDQITDDLQLLELAGQETWLVPGDESNIKITTPQDLLLAELLLRRAKS